MDLGLKGRNAAVTGSSQGIGNAIAMALAAEGCNVALSARGKERLDKAVAAAAAKDVKAIGIVCDLSSSAGCKKFIDEAVAGLGGLDILVNNVGGMVPGTVDSITDEQWTQFLNTSLLSYVWATRYAIPHLKKSKGGRILNVSSTSGIWGLPGQSDYATAKGGLIAFTKSLALELAPFVQVNCIAPGYIDTEFAGGWPAKEKQAAADRIPLRRFGTGDDVAALAVFLAAEAEYLTGQVIVVDGGLMLRGR